MPAHDLPPTCQAWLDAQDDWRVAATGLFSQPLSHSRQRRVLQYFQKFIYGQTSVTNDFTQCAFGDDFSGMNGYNCPPPVWMAIGCMAA